jgi:integrase
MKTLEPETAPAFLKAVAGDRYEAIWLLLLVTGMRPGEALALRWSEVDLKSKLGGGSVTVLRSLTWRKGGDCVFRSEPKTASGIRQILIPPLVVGALKAHRARQAEMRLKAGSAWQDLDLVFATEAGTPNRRENLTQRHLKPIYKTVGLPPGFRLYDLRHSCATLLLVEGTHPKVVSERLGHASVALTLDTYSHVLPTMQAGASDAMERILLGQS